jgi:ribonuclease P/MRP protein subunit POP5
MKILPPTLRESNRYIAFSIISYDEISRRDLINEIFYSSRTLLGDVGSSEMGLRLFSFEDNKGIIRCAAAKTWEARAVLATIFSIKNIRTRINVLGISGTIQRATEKYLLTKSINKAESERKETQELTEYEIVINKMTIVGSIINKQNNEVDLLPKDYEYNEILNRSNTKYIGMTVFDLNNKEIINNANDTSNGI